MAYIFQHRRDTLTNWNSVNPVLADAEIGFIKDLDENGKQKTSLYKIGDGQTAWNDLPLFGFGGTVRNTVDAWKGSDLDTTVASQQAILDKLTEKLQPVHDQLSDLYNVKIDRNQLIQDIAAGDNDETQILSKAAVLAEFASLWTALNTNAEADANFITLTTADINTLKAFAQNFNDVFVPRIDALEELSISHSTTLDQHGKDLYGWDEEVDTEETDPETGEVIKTTIHHDSVDEKITKVDVKVDAADAKIDDVKNEIIALHQVLTEVEYAALDKSTYPEGTLFFTYKAE